MPRNTSFTLSDHFIEFIDQQVASGRYGSASEVVREGLRLVEETEQHLNWLRAEIQRGLDDIEAGRVQRDSDELWDQIEQRARQRVKSMTPGAGNGES